jgi:hypothetical protein
MTDAPKRGGARAGAGRKRLPDEVRRTVRVEVLLSPSEEEAIEAARGEVERAVWMREAVMAKARRARRTG